MPRNSQRVLSTDRQLQGVTCSGDRAEFRIKGAKNLVLRVTAAGTKTWMYLYRSPISGKRAKLSIGTYPSCALARARSEAMALTLAVEQGKDPLAERRAFREADSFEELAKVYMAEHKVRRTRAGRVSVTTNEAQRILDADILPQIGACKAHAVKKYHVTAIVEKVAARGSFIAADRALGLVRAIYNWANGTGRLEVNPTLGLKKRNAGRARRRVLSDDEIRKLWLRLDDPSPLSNEVRDAFRLELLLGLRIGEVLGAAQSEIDLVLQTWTIPPHRTKANREHCVPLPPHAARIITRSMERAGKSQWLFPSARSDEPVRTKSAVRAMARLRGDLGISDVGTHDLRRTIATGLGNLGTSDELVSRILNHAPRSVAGKHYNWSVQLDAMRRALEIWSQHVAKVVSNDEPSSNVVRMRLRGSND